jgi:hypothetical protein
MAHFKLLEGQTLETALEYGAVYVSAEGQPKTMFVLYAKAIQRLGYIPQPDVAWLMFRVIEDTKP